MMDAMPLKSNFGSYSLSLLLLAAIGGLVAVAISPTPKATPRSAAAAASPVRDDAPTLRFVKNPEPAPFFLLTDLAGKALSLPLFRGKVVLLNFWATWCGPCRSEIPGLIELQEKYGDRLQVVGLSTDEGAPDAVKRYVDKAHINYPVAMATPEIAQKYGGILALPTSFLLDTQGRVVQKHIGLWDQAYFELEIRALLGLPVDAKIETFEDLGQVFLVNASRAQELPGVDVSKLSTEQKKIALRRFNEQTCSCNCRLTLAQCRINDSACEVSKKETAQVVQEILHPSPAHPQPPGPTAPVQPPSPTSPD
jgi:thiol-disulfide isomerase/thioredoxin